jgi:hypothetical protein
VAVFSLLHCERKRGRQGGGGGGGGGGLLSFRIASGSESYNGRSKPDV